MKAQIRQAARAVAVQVKRHPKKTAGAGIGLTTLVWIAAGIWTTYLLNQKTFEQRFDQAQRDIAGSPREQVYDLVLEHERLVRSLAARGVVPPPLSPTDGGVLDPLMQEILRPSTVAEKLRVSHRPTQDPASVVKLLEERNAELRSRLATSPPPAFAPQSQQLTSASDAPPDSTLELNRVVRSPQPVQEGGPSAQSLQAADSIKALCAAKGDSVKELGNACEDPTLAITRLAEPQAR